MGGRKYLINPYLTNPCLALILSLSFISSLFANPIVLENTNPGTTQWQLTRPAGDSLSQIKGYTNKLSVLPGESIKFHISVNPAQSYTVRYFRMGYYAGDGGREMFPADSRSGRKQDDCNLNNESGQITCNWTSEITKVIPSDWVSGVYLAKITNDLGFDNHIPFLVKRPLGDTPDLLYQQPVTTYHAYNKYPDDMVTGKSTYDSKSYGDITIADEYYPDGTDDPTHKPKIRAVRVSFDRPYENTGSYLFLHLEHELIMYLEEHGYDIGYVTDIDTHETPAYLNGIKGFISAGHDEYWTGEMFTAVENARDNGVDLAFFGANAAFWQIKLKPGNGRENRVMEVYKNFKKDPEPDPARKTITFRESGRAEQRLVGVQYIDYAWPAGTRESFIARNTDHWIFEGTGLSNGDQIPGVIGGEMDVLFSSFPRPMSNNYTVIGRSPILGATKQLDGNRRIVEAETVVYQAPSNAWVFASATLLWQKGLVASGGSSSPALRRMTKNLLDKFIDRNTGTPPTLSLSSPNVTEGSGNLNVNISLSNAVDYPISLKIATNAESAQPGIDFIGRYQPLTIPAGETNVVWTVQIVDDSIRESDETLRIRVWDINGAVNNTATLSPTIFDNDQPAEQPLLSMSNRVVQENAGTVPVTVTLSEPSTNTVTLDFSTTNGGSATPGVDYYGLSNTLEIAPGQTSVTQLLSIVDDVSREAQETIRVQIFNAQNATVSNRYATVTILSDD